LNENDNKTLSSLKERGGGLFVPILFVSPIFFSTVPSSLVKPLRLPPFLLNGTNERTNDRTDYQSRSDRWTSITKTSCSAWTWNGPTTCKSASFSTLPLPPSSFSVEFKPRRTQPVNFIWGRDCYFVLSTGGWQWGEEGAKVTSWNALFLGQWAMKADDKKKHFFCFQRELRREQRSSKASECGNNFFIFSFKTRKVEKDVSLESRLYWRMGRATWSAFASSSRCFSVKKGKKKMKMKHKGVIGVKECGKRWGQQD